MEMIAPRKIKYEAKKKRDENYEFRIYLKGNWTNSFTGCIKNYLTYMTAADAETVARCTGAASRKKISPGMQSIWGLQKISLLKNICWKVMRKTDTRQKTPPVIFWEQTETASWVTAGRETVRNIHIRISRTGGRAFTACWM